jgi:hypothetical protein
MLRLSQTIMHWGRRPCDGDTLSNNAVIVKKTWATRRLDRARVGRRSREKDQGWPWLLALLREYVEDKASNSERPCSVKTPENL